MSDRSILEHITALVDEEHQLRSGSGTPEEKQQRLRHVSEQLDQCWDLLRQRRAREETGEDPDAVTESSVDDVESYLQ